MMPKNLNPSPKRFYTNLLLIGISLISLLVVEMLLRLVNIPKRGDRYDISLPFIIEDNRRNMDWRGFHTFRDELFTIDKMIYENPEESVFWVPRPNIAPFNSEGTIGDLVGTACNSTRCIKILAVGDSNTLWDGKSSFPMSLQDTINRDSELNCEARLINAGVHGFSSYQGYKYLKRFISYRPNVVIISFGWNDTLPARAPADKNYGRRLYAFLNKKESIVLNNIRKSRIVQILEKGIIFIITQSVKPTTEHRVPLEDFIFNINEMVKIAEGIGAVPVLITRPHYFRKEKIHDFEFYVDKYNDILKKYAKEQGILLFDMAEYIKNFPPTEVFSDYSHLNIKGHSLSAIKLYSDLKNIIISQCNKQNN